MERTILQLDAIGLAAAEKLDGIVVHERHVPQIQNQFLPRCLGGEQLLELLYILGFDPATDCEQDLSIGRSPSSQHVSSLLLKTADAPHGIPLASLKESRIEKGSLMANGKLLKIKSQSLHKVPGISAMTKFRAERRADNLPENRLKKGSMGSKRLDRSAS